MNDFIKNIKYFILSLKEKSLLRKLKDSTRQSYTNNDTKNVMIKGASLTINSKTLQTIAQVKENVTSIIQKTNGEPDALIDYIKAAKTPVYKIKNADKILNFINEEEGLITEKEGFDALILSVSTGQGIKFKTAPMFVMREGIIEKYYMLHHFYCWYSLKSGLPGFDYKSRKCSSNIWLTALTISPLNFQWLKYFLCRRQLPEIKKLRLMCLNIPSKLKVLKMLWIKLKTKAVQIFEISPVISLAFKISLL